MRQLPQCWNPVPTARLMDGRTKESGGKFCKAWGLNLSWDLELSATDE